MNLRLLTNQEYNKLRDGFVVMVDGFGLLAEFIESGADIPEWFEIDFAKLETAFNEFISRSGFGCRNIKITRTDEPKWAGLEKSKRFWNRCDKFWDSLYKN